MKTVADLKRCFAARPAVVLDRFECSGAPAQHKYLNVPRYIVHVQSNSYAFATDPQAPRSEWCWGDWPKASEFTADADGNGFTFNSENGRVILHYRIVPGKQ